MIFMLVDYPDEWRKYMTSPGNKIFKKDTPKEVIERARRTNEHLMKTCGMTFYDLSLVDEDEDEK